MAFDAALVMSREYSPKLRAFRFLTMTPWSPPVLDSPIQPLTCYQVHVKLHASLAALADCEWSPVLDDSPGTLGEYYFVHVPISTTPRSRGLARPCS